VRCVRPQGQVRVATALFATTVPALAPRGAVLLRQNNVGPRRLDAFLGPAWGTFRKVYVARHVMCVSLFMTQ
jgi:hypothetical protein